MSIALLALLFVAVSATKLSLGALLAAGPGLDIYSVNPHYLQYDGHPVLLLGGSSGPTNALNDEGMFLWPDPTGSLTKLEAAGGNYVRCLVSGRLRDGELWPFARVGDHYDLDRWDEAYWRLFEAFLKETKTRSIVSDIELWATFDYYRQPWERNPFNPRNNINYTAEATGLPTAVNSHPVATKNDFFRSIPDEKNIETVLRYQQRFVDKVLSYTLQFDHVLYCMDNETSVSPKWGAYWARYVRAAADKAGRKIFITEMFDPHDLNHPMHSQVIDHPEVYEFIEIAQNNHQTGETHYDRIMEVRRRIAASPRPLTNAKIYGVDGGLFGTTQEGIARFWRNIFAGCASARFHEKHLGDREPALRMIRAARSVVAAFDIFRCEPRNDLLADREPNEAYCLANPGQEYAIYFPAGRGVGLSLPAPATRFRLRWFDVDGGQWTTSTQVEASGKLTLEAPGAGQWVAVLTAIP
jgi:hypothetical protein